MRSSATNNLLRARPATPFATLIDALRWRAEHETDRLAYRFLPDGETNEIVLTYGELDHRARTIAAHLQSLQRRGDRALVVYPAGLEFIAAYFGCLYAGSMAVIVHPPHQARLPQFLSKTLGIWQDASPTVALTTSAIHDLLAATIAQTTELRAALWLATDADRDEPVPPWHPTNVTADDLAFLQYTSGSTTEPKGVMVSHGNLVHNLRSICDGLAQPSGTESVCWLPPHHDMGLIGGILTPLYSGTTATLLPPVAFVQRPGRWLQAISRFRATVSGGPNFAYDHCIQRITPEQCAGLDLSNWEVAFTGAEPINVQTLRNFADRFSSSGFHSSAFRPCYGLAEATVMVSATPRRGAPVVLSVRSTDLSHHRVVPCDATEGESHTFSSCGQPVAQVRIVDPATCAECPPWRIGEIWVSGPSVALGYWNRPEETAITFQGQLEGRDESFLRTGDLGFLRDGELFVTGRLKDLIIVEGANHYPQDIERTVAECHPALGPAECAAFSVEAGGREALVVVVAPIRRSNLPVDEIHRAIRMAVAKHHDLRLHEIVLIKPGRLPKTTSGKIRRHACRSDYLSGTLDRWVQQ